MAEKKRLEAVSRRMGIAVPQGEYDRLLAYLKQRRMTVSEFVRMAIENEAARAGLVIDLSVNLGGPREGAGRPKVKGSR